MARRRPTAGLRCCGRRAAAGLAANLELMTTRAERLAELGRPCLPHLDCLIVNDFEIGALAGRETRRADGSTDVAAVARAIDEALTLGAMRWAAAHFPEGAVVGGRDGSRVALGSVAIPQSAIIGANGAGDAFAAGMLYGLHEQWPIRKGLELASCLALRPRCARYRRRRASRRSQSAWRWRSNGAFGRFRSDSSRSG